MKILKIEKTTLASALAAVTPAVASRTAVPILTHVLLRVAGADQTLTLGATSLEVSALLTVAALDTDESWEMAVPARELTDIVGKMPSGTLLLEYTERTQSLAVSVVGQKTTATLKGMDAGAFPLLVEIDAAFTLEGGVLAGLLSQASTSAASDESRPTLMSIKLSYKDKVLSAAATDGYRLSERKVTVSTAVDEPRTWLVPSRALRSHVIRALAAAETIGVGFTENLISLQIPLGTLGTLHWTSNTLDDSYPDYKAIIPRVSEQTIRVSAKELLEALKLPAVYAHSNANIVKFVFEAGSDKAVLSATAADLGSAEVELPLLEAAEADLSINFNFVYIEAAAANWGAHDSLSIGFTQATRPCIMLPSGMDWEADGCDVIMPMHPSR